MITIYLYFVYTYITEFIFSRNIKMRCALKDKIIKICIHHMIHIAHLFYSKWIHIYRSYLNQWCESVYFKNIKPFKNFRKNTGSKSRYFFIYQNRISNKLRTKNINVIGSCCWKICPRIGFGRCQALKPGDKKKPNVSYISRIQAYNC